MSLSRTMRTETSSPLFRRLRDAMEDAGWSTRLPRERGPWMLAASKGSARYSVILEEVQVPRRSSFQGLLADAVLRGRAAAGPRGRFLVVVGAPLISSSMADSIEAYVGEVVPGQPFGYVDGRGLVRLFGPGLEQVRKEPARSSGSRPVVGQPRDLFSDLNQWMLKVVFGARLPAGMIGVPRDPALSAAALAAGAGVSTPAAWRLLASLRAGGYLDDAGQAVRVHDLFARWRAASLRPQRQVRARWVLPGRDPLETLRARLVALCRSEKMPSVCVGLFAACDALGVGHVRGAPVHLYVRRVDEPQLEALGLALAPRGQEGDVLVRVARWPESVFRGTVSVGGVPVADVIQCWLDVSAEPGRGAEQAAFIWQRVLGPAIAGGDREP